MQWRSKTFTGDRHPRVTRYVGQRLGGGLSASGAHGVHRGRGGRRGRRGRGLVVELSRRCHTSWRGRHRRPAVVLTQRVVHHRIRSHCSRISATLVVRWQTPASRERHRATELLVVRHVWIHPRRRARRRRRRWRGALRAPGPGRAGPQRGCA